MAEETTLESTERTSGREALRKNVQAAIALSGAVRSTLGPKGLDKLLVDDEEEPLLPTTASQFSKQPKLSTQLQK